MKEHQAPAEIDELAGLYGAPHDRRHTLTDTSFRPLNGRRVAEVAMAIRRPNGKVLLQTKEDYPNGVFRLPTGGLKRGEEIASALLRETEEETALEVAIRRFVATLTYRSRDEKTVFRSYLFLLDEVGGTLRETEPEEGISGWIEADVNELEHAGQILRAVPKSWRGWGEFRALAIDAIVPAL